MGNNVIFHSINSSLPDSRNGYVADNRMSLEKHRKLVALVPDYPEDEYAILAACYYKRGRLTLDQAVDIGGFSSEDEFAAFIGCRRERISWAEKARLIRHEKERGDYRNFKVWLKREFGLNASHTVRLLKAEREFGGTAVEGLPLERVFRLFRLSDEQRRELKEAGTIRIEGRAFTVEDLGGMQRNEFFRLTL